MHGLGRNYATLDNTRRAVEYYEQSLSIAREIGDKRMEAAILAEQSTALLNEGYSKLPSLILYKSALFLARVAIMRE